MEIRIEEYISQDMLSIFVSSERGLEQLFFGNYSDFDVSGNTFKQLFEKLNIETNLIQIEESE
jgi:hypothetical protein